MKTLNDYGTLLLTNTMADLVELFNNNTNNSSLVDSLLSYTIDTGVFRTGLEQVNGMSVGPHNNLQFPLNTIGEIRFEGFVFYFKSLHKVITDVLTADLSDYKDSNLHLLYLKPDHTFEILDTKYTGNGDYLLVARFLIKSDGVVQFYVTTRNAGTNPFDKSGITYQVLNGLVPSAVEDKAITVSDGTIKYSGINILSETNTDILKDTFDGVVMPMRYVTVYNQIDWTEASTNDIDTNHIMNYGTETKSTVPANKYSCQKAFYDYNTKSIVMQYGTVVYDTYNEALAGASNFNYDEPDWDGLYIPIAVFVIKSGATDLTVNENFHVISITNNSSLSAATAVDPVAQDLANSALAAAQAAQQTADTAEGKADDAQADATQALSDAADAQSDADDANSKIDDHLADTNNPHNVSKSDVGLGNVDNTADLSKPLSNPQKEYIDGQVDDLTVEINKRPLNTEQTKCVVKATQPTASDYGRNPIKGDIWIIP